LPAALRANAASDSIFLSDRRVFSIVEFQFLLGIDQ
jgi:hypothetical protein